MAHDFYKSPEGVEAYKKVGLSYDDELWDRQYDDFLKLTRRTPPKEARIEISNIMKGR
jgi:hypothetical protein